MTNHCGKTHGTVSKHTWEETQRSDHKGRRDKIGVGRDCQLNKRGKGEKRLSIGQRGKRGAKIVYGGKRGKTEVEDVMMAGPKIA